MNKQNDPTSPNHYKHNGLETWDVIEAWMTPEEFRGYLEGNVIKYVSRWKDKNGLEDLKKARVYLDKLISKVEGPKKADDGSEDFQDGERKPLPEEELTYAFVVDTLKRFEEMHEHTVEFELFARPLNKMEEGKDVKYILVAYYNELNFISFGQQKLTKILIYKDTTKSGFLDMLSDFDSMLNKQKELINRLTSSLTKCDEVIRKSNKEILNKQFGVKSQEDK